MKRLTLGMTFAGLLLSLFYFAMPARAMVDDYCGNGWWWQWWKGPYPPPHWADVTQITINPAIPGEILTNDVLFTVQNRLSEGVRGGQTYMLMHSLRRRDGVIVSTETIARGYTPNLLPGQRFQIRGRTQTPRVGTYEHVLQLNVR
jgi:hypothetical protein